MKHPRHLYIEDYTYHLPEEKIAKYPLKERDASKLLIYKDGKIAEDIYRNIAAHIPAETLLVFNQTKVIYARLLFQKPTGGVIEIFCLEPDNRYADIQTAMLQKGMIFWKCMVGGASKWKHGMTLQLQSKAPNFILTAEVVSHEPEYFVLELSWNTDLTFAEVLHYAGKVPIPPYLHRKAEVTDEERYQTIYAKEEGSVAAPTAGLHFTEQVLKDLEKKGIDKAFVTLHVGAGTFKPVKSETMQEHTIHAEWIDVEQQLIKELLDHIDKGIVAVGTTSMRTLESLYWIGNKLHNGLQTDFSGITVSQWEPYECEQQTTPKQALQAIWHYMQTNQLQRITTRTQILIAPGYDCKIIKGLVTNFHQPQSTLLLLVAAIIGDDWRKLYEYALAHQYRFLSYGDGCLLWKNTPQQG